MFPVGVEYIAAGPTSEYIGAFIADDDIVTLPAKQIAPYAPLEIQRADLDSDPVSNILNYLKTTGKLILDGNSSANQQSLFEENQ